MVCLTAEGGDILSSSSVRVRGSVLEWKPLCPADQSDPSVSLCWRIHMQNSYCVPAPNTTLHRTKLVRDDPTNIVSAEVTACCAYVISIWSTFKQQYVARVTWPHYVTFCVKLVFKSPIKCIKNLSSLNTASAWMHCIYCTFCHLSMLCSDAAGAKKKKLNHTVNATI